MGFKSAFAVAASWHPCHNSRARKRTRTVRYDYRAEGPGGASDIVSRIVADKVQASLRQPVVVETRPGANGKVGAAYAYRSLPTDTR